MPTPPVSFTVHATTAEVRHAGGDHVPWLLIAGPENRRSVLRLDAVLGWHFTLHETVRVDTVNGAYDIVGKAAPEIDRHLTDWLLNGGAMNEDFGG